MLGEQLTVLVKAVGLRPHPTPFGARHAVRARAGGGHLATVDEDLGLGPFGLGDQLGGVVLGPRRPILAQVARKGLRFAQCRAVAAARARWAPGTPSGLRTDGGEGGHPRRHRAHCSPHGHSEGWQMGAKAETLLNMPGFFSAQMRAPWPPMLCPVMPLTPGMTGKFCGATLAEHRAAPRTAAAHRLNQRRQLGSHVLVHLVVVAPARLSGVEVEAGSGAKIPASVVPLHRHAAGRCVRAHDGDAVLRRQPLPPGLGHKVLMGARQSRQKIQRGHGRLGRRLRSGWGQDAVSIPPVRAPPAARLWRQIHGKSHGAFGGFGGMGENELRAVKAGDARGLSQRGCHSSQRPLRKGVR